MTFDATAILALGWSQDAEGRWHSPQCKMHTATALAVIFKPISASAPATPQFPPNKVGRPRKYASKEEARAARQQKAQERRQWLGRRDG